MLMAPYLNEDEDEDEVMKPFFRIFDQIPYCLQSPFFSFEAKKFFDFVGTLNT